MKKLYVIKLKDDIFPNFGANRFALYGDKYLSGESHKDMCYVSSSECSKFRFRKKAMETMNLYTPELTEGDFVFEEIISIADL